MLVSLLTNLDFLSHEIKLTVKSGDTRVKTLFGGILSLFYVCCCLFFFLYFFIKFITKSSLTVIISRETSPFLNMTESSEIPVLLRWADSNGLPYDNSSRIYRISMKFFYAGSNTTIDMVHKSRSIPIETCSREKHWGKYKDYFSHITDLETFYCLTERNHNETWYGIYGGMKPFSYYHFYISQCVNTTDDTSCFDPETINAILARTYFEYRTIDYDINNYNKTPESAIVKSERSMVSNSVSKRIWIYFKLIQYVTDTGIWFEIKQKEQFYQLDNYRSDIDLRDNMKYHIPGTFIEFTMLTSAQGEVYSRKYLKLQDYFATIGGTVTFISNLSFLLNYLISQNSFFIYWIKMSSFKKQSITRDSYRNFTSFDLFNKTKMDTKGMDGTNMWGKGRVSLIKPRMRSVKGISKMMSYKTNIHFIKEKLALKSDSDYLSQEAKHPRNMNNYQNTSNVGILNQSVTKHGGKLYDNNNNKRNFTKFRLWFYFTPVYLFGNKIKNKAYFIQQCMVINEKLNIFNWWNNMNDVSQLKEIVTNNNNSNKISRKGWDRGIDL